MEIKRGDGMARKVSIGTQDFEKIIVNNCFYVDKTHFIKEWWESTDEVTLITHPRRFGKTLNMDGYWEELASFTRNLFHNTFKTNPYLERALMTGITNLSWAKSAKQTSNGSALAETIFSDLNNLKVITMTSNSYSSCFGFEEKEVFAAMDEFGMINKEGAKNGMMVLLLGIFRLSKSSGNLWKDVRTGTYELRDTAYV